MANIIDALIVILEGYKKSGKFCDVCGFSFYSAINLGALCDGGAIILNDDELANIIRALRNYCPYIKYNDLYKSIYSRLDTIQSALLSVKLKYLDNETE